LPRPLAGAVASGVLYVRVDLKQYVDVMDGFTSALCSALVYHLARAVEARGLNALATVATTR